MFGSENEMCSSYSSFTTLHKRIPLRYDLWGDHLRCILLMLRHLKHNKIDVDRAGLQLALSGVQNK